MATQDREEAVMGSAPEFDGARALGRFRDRVRRERIVPTTSWSAELAARLQLASGSLLRPVVAGVAVIVLAFAATVTGVAETFLTIFEPQRIQTVRVDPREFGKLPDPSAFGTLTWVSQPRWQPVADASAAAAVAGFTPLTPSALPAGVPSTAQVRAMPEAKATFRFDEAKAREAAARAGASAPPMPAQVAATTLTMTGGPAVMQQYGSAPNVSPDKAAWGGNPPVMIVQARAPVVTSNGATVEELRDYALSMPGVPPSLAAQVRAIGDPVRTMLIPVGVDLNDAKPVTVRGTQGYVFGDDTGLGSGVVWLERGYVFGVLGSLKEAELIALANGLR